KTTSYLKIAKDYGNANAVRAVAAAIGKNPILIAVPCHRVIGSNGSLVGFSSGIVKKKWLLKKEEFSLQTEVEF
ncbi:MAG: methylated-DNA--[protein]-cysteine S-methyltransferase, partial [Flavobacteriaceae bacterium]